MLLLPMSSLDASRDSPDSSVSIASTLHKQGACHSAPPCLSVVAHSPLPLALRLVLPSLGRQHQPQTVLHAPQKLLSGPIVKVKGYLVGYKGILLQSPGGGVTAHRGRSHSTQGEESQHTGGGVTAHRGRSHSTWGEESEHMGGGVRAHRGRSQSTQGEESEHTGGGVRAHRGRSQSTQGERPPTPPTGHRHTPQSPWLA